LDPNLTNPIILNATINATLLQQPQPWVTPFIPIINAIISISATIFGIYLGHRWERNAEKERDFKKARKLAYYKYISTFSNQSGQNDEWTSQSISRTLPDILNVALEAGEYGDIISNIYFNCRPDLFREIRKTKGSHPWMGLSNINSDVKVIKLHIASLRDFVLLLEFLLLIDPKSINKNEIEEIIKVGQSYFQPLMEKLWENEKHLYQLNKWEASIKRYLRPKIK